MKFNLSRKCLLFVALFLAFAFAGREIPELLSLADDVSNDGARIGVVYGHGIDNSVRSHRSDVGAPSHGGVSVRVSRLAFSNFPQFLRPQVGTNLLHLLSILRE